MNKNSIVRYILILLNFVPLFSAIAYVLIFCVNVPYWDQFYHNIEGLVRYFNGTLSFEFLFSQGNESRPFFLRIISLILGIFTGYNLVYESLLGVIFSLLSFFIIFLMYKKDNGVSNLSLLLFLPVAFFFFNLYQIGNYLFGFHYGHALAILGFVAAVYLIDTSKRINLQFLCAIVAAVIASFTYVGGLTIWPVCFIQIFLNEPLYKIKKLALWAVSAIGVYFIYYSGYIQPSYHPSLFYVFQHFKTGIIGFFLSVGTAVFHDVTLYPEPDILLAPFFGIFLIVLIILIVVVNRNRDNFKQNVKWMSLIIFSILLSAEITIARSAYGLQYIYQMRYFLMTYPAIIGLYCISLNQIIQCRNNSSVNISTNERKIPESAKNTDSINHILFGIILTLLIIGIVSHDLAGIEYGNYSKKTRTELVYILQNYDYQSDERLVLIHPVGDPSMIPNMASEIRSYASFMEMHNMSVFSKQRINPEQLPISSKNTQFRVDLINGKVIGNEPFTINKTADPELIIEGWAIDSLADAPAGAVYISMDGRLYPTLYSLERQDIADHFRNENLLKTGFRLSATTSILEQGSHNLSVLVISNDRTEVYRPNTHFIVEII